MKKQILFASLLASMTLISCNKDRWCVCEARVNGETIKTETIITDTKKNAKEKCDEGDVTTMTEDVTCYLK